MRRLGPGCAGVVGRTTPRVLAAVLERCDLLLANDGGVAHVAATVQTPTVAVFGPSNDAAWRPLGAHVVAADIPCRPCFYRDFQIGLRGGCATRECLALVSPTQVAARALAILEDHRVAV
jgi:ADP-heptose:LPS heptosyltransferase